MGQRNDLSMIGTAIKKRWLTERLKNKALRAIEDGLDSSDDRVRQAATRALIAMESQNQQDEHKVIDGIEFGNDRLAAIAADLGIDPALIVDGTATPTGRAATDAEDTCNNGA